MHVIFFAHLKDATRCGSAELTVPAPISTEELWAALLERFPALKIHRPNTRLALNGAYAGAEARFADADEVALIPPVSGG
jgi:molybdopterin converting factor subunit 1